MAQGAKKMTQINDLRAACVAALFFSLTHSQLALAADWSITQTSNVSAPTTQLTQDGVSNSQQGINGVVLDADNDSLSNSTQTANLAGADLELEQIGDDSNNNVQAVNLASAQSIEGLSQQVIGFNEIQISSDSVSGSDNTQALNYASAATNISNLTQAVTGVTVIANNGVVGSVQALNYAEAATYSGTLEQSVSLDVLDVTSLNGGEVRVNSVQGNLNGLTSPLIQNVNITNLVVNPGSTYVMNHVSP